MQYVRKRHLQLYGVCLVFTNMAFAVCSICSIGESGICGTVGIHERSICSIREQRICGILCVCVFEQEATKALIIRMREQKLLASERVDGSCWRPTVRGIAPEVNVIYQRGS